MRKDRFVLRFAVGAIAIAIVSMVGMLEGPAKAQTACSVSAGTPPFTILHSFSGAADDGASPEYASLTLSGTNLYGMSSGGGADSLGTIFKFDMTTSELTVLHSFAGGASDGASPLGSLTLSGSTTLYGMTFHGGTGNLGTIFKFDVETDEFTVLHSFAGGANDGASPFGSSLTLSGKTLYGVTFYGGAGNLGTIFKFNVGTGKFTVLHSFAWGASDGANPVGSLTLSGTTLYGITNVGGLSDSGTIFKFDIYPGKLTVLHSFAWGASDGVNPVGSLTLAGSTLYGMTYAGGVHGMGTIFKFELYDIRFTVLHSFAGGTNDGESPQGSVIVSGTTLYGITDSGGGGGSPLGGGFGTVYTFDTKSRNFSLLHRFEGGTNDGIYPQGHLTLSGKTLYGMTSSGGADYAGTIFSMPSVPLTR